MPKTVDLPVSQFTARKLIENQRQREAIELAGKEMLEMLIAEAGLTGHLELTGLSVEDPEKPVLQFLSSESTEKKLAVTK